MTRDVAGILGKGTWNQEATNVNIWRLFLFLKAINPNVSNFSRRDQHLTPIAFLSGHSQSKGIQRDEKMKGRL